MTKYTKTFADALKQVREPKVVKEDYEVSMAVGQLKTIQERVGKIMDFLSGKSDDYNMEAWLQSKITSAEDKLNSVANYVTNNPEVNETKLQEQDASKIGPAGKIALAKEKDTDALEAQIVDLKGRLALAQQKIENEKNKAVKPVPNPLTGEVPLQTGLAHAILKIKDDAQKEQNKTKQVSKQIKKLSRESLDVVTESDASDKAKGMGLTYMKFGRYGKDGKVTHKSIGGSLTAVDKDEKPVKEPKSAKPKDEPKKDAAPADADEIKLKSKNFLRDLEKGNLENDDGMIEIDMDDDGQGAMAASELAAKQGLTDLASDLEDVAMAVQDSDPDVAQALLQDIEAKNSGKEIEAKVQSQKADKAIDLVTAQDYSASNINNMVTDLTSTFDIIRKMVDSDKTEGNPGSGNMNSSKGFRPEVIDTLQSLGDVSDRIEDVIGDVEDEKTKSKLQSVLDEIEFVTDENADHDNYTKPHKVNSAINSAIELTKQLQMKLKEEADLSKPQIKKVHKMADELPKKDFKDRYGKEKGDAVRYATATNIVKKKEGIKEEMRLRIESMAALKKKADKSGMPYSILKKVFDRGMAAWKGGHRPGASQHQWAYARVNSFTTKSSGTWGGADKDLAAKVKGSK